MILVSSARVLANSTPSLRKHVCTQRQISSSVGLGFEGLGVQAKLDRRCTLPASRLKPQVHVSYCLNSLKGGNIGDFMGHDYRG